MGRHGALMAATLLNGPRAVSMSVYVVRAWVRMRETLLGRAGMEKRLAETSAAGQSSPPLGNGSRAGGAEHGLRGRAGEPADPSRDTRPERATRFVETTHGVLSYSQLAPLLAERVVLVQADIERSVYDSRSFEESLLLEFHRPSADA